MPPVMRFVKEPFLMVGMGCENVWHTLLTDEKIDKKYRKYSLLYFFLVWNYEYLCIRQAASQHNSQASLELLHSICIIFA